MFSPEDHRMLAYAVRSAPVDHRRWKPAVVETAPNCPRCDSSNTKFCYYNNYSHTQPRYFCKGCRRYWTKGGSLRNVPVGGGCRKNRRGKAVRVSTDSKTSSSSSIRQIDNTRVMDSVLRPDQALDDMFDNNLGLAAGGSNIDMAVMYARFVNQMPHNFPIDIEDSTGFVGSVGAEFSSSSTLSTAMGSQVASQAEENNLEFMVSNCSREQSVGALGFTAGHGSSESLSILATMNCGDPFPMNWGLVSLSKPWPAEEHHHDAVSTRLPPEIETNHFQELMIGDWNAMEKSGFQAF